MIQNAQIQIELKNKKFCFNPHPLFSITPIRGFIHDKKKVTKFYTKRSYFNIKKNVYASNDSIYSPLVKFAIPDFLNIQRASFRYFLKYGLIEEFSKYNCIKNSDQTLEVFFYAEHYKLTRPKWTPKQAILKRKSYACQLFLPIQLSNYKTEEVRLQWVLLANLPLMTKHGHFIFNGCPRVLMNQMVRSPGVYFKKMVSLNKKTVYCADFIAQRGSWLRLQVDTQKGDIWAKLKKTPKIPILIFLRALGISIPVLNNSLDYRKFCYISQLQNEMKKSIKIHRFLSSGTTRINNSQDITQLQTLVKSLKQYMIPRTPKKRDKRGTVKTRQRRGWPTNLFETDFSALLELFKQLSPNQRFYEEKPELIEPKLAQKFLFRKFLNPRTYDLSLLGRSKINKKLGLSIPLDHTQLTGQDVLVACLFLMDLLQGLVLADDIDDLANRKIKPSGDLLKTQLAIGLIRLDKILREKLNQPNLEPAFFTNLFSVKPINQSFREFFGTSPLSQLMDQTNALAELTHKRRLSSLGPGGINRENAGMSIRGIHPTHYGRICPIETPEGQNAGLVNSFTTYSNLNTKGFIETPFYKTYKGFILKNNNPLLFSSDQESQWVLAPGDISLSTFSVLRKGLLPARQLKEFKRVSRNAIHFTAMSPIQMISVATSLIPFLEHDDGNRALMGSNMQRQSIPTLRPSKPIVATGLESRVISDVGHGLQVKNSGFVSSVDGKEIIIYSLGNEKPPSLVQKNLIQKDYLQQKMTTRFLFKKQLVKTSKKSVLGASCFKNKNVGKLLEFAFFDSVYNKSKSIQPFFRVGIPKITFALQKINKTRLDCHYKKLSKKENLLKQQTHLNTTNLFFFQTRLFLNDFLGHFLILPGFQNTPLKKKLFTRSVFLMNQFSHQQFLLTYCKKLLFPVTKNCTGSLQNFEARRVAASRGSIFTTEKPIQTEKLFRELKNTVLRTRPLILTSKKGKPKSPANLLAPFKGQIFRRVEAKKCMQAIDLVKNAYNRDLKTRLTNSIGSESQTRVNLATLLNRKKLEMFSQNAKNNPRFVEVKKQNSFLAQTDIPAGIPMPVFFNTNLASQKYSLNNYHRSNQDTYMIHRPIVQEGQWVEKGDILADSSASVQGELAIGQNILVGYTPWEGYNFEDAVLISERVVYDDLYTSLHIERYEVEVRDTPFGLEQITNQLNVALGPCSYLDANGIAKIGTWVKEGDILVGKIAPTGQKNVNPYEKLLYAILGKETPKTRDTSLRVPRGVNGRVVHIEIVDKDTKKNASQIQFKKVSKIKKLRKGQKKVKKYAPLTFPPRGKARARVPFSLNKPNDTTRTSTLLGNEKNRANQTAKQCDLILHRPLPFLLKNVKHPTRINIKSLPNNSNLVFNSQSSEKKEILKTKETNKMLFLTFNFSENAKKKWKKNFKIHESVLERKIAQLRNWHFSFTSSQIQKTRRVWFEKAKLAKKCRQLSLFKPRSYSRQKRFVDFDITSLKSVLFGPFFSNQKLRLKKETPSRSFKKATQTKTVFLSQEKNVLAPVKVYIYLAEKRKLQVGDKIAGRHGNKGIVSNILPRQDMPYVSDGTPLDIVLNPLGVPSRMNVGQIFECLLGLAGYYLNQNYKIQPFDEIYGSEASRSLVYSKLYEARIKTGQDWLFNPNFPGKTRLFDGRSGDCFEQPVTVGMAYILKLIHLVDDKIHARSTGPYSLVTQQPLRGRAKQGGQRVGEMEVWALEGFGAAYILQEILTVKSDDLHGRKLVMDCILKNRPMQFSLPESFKLLVCELRSLCLNMVVYKETVLTDDFPIIEEPPNFSTLKKKTTALNRADLAQRKSEKTKTKPRTRLTEIDISTF